MHRVRYFAGGYYNQQHPYHYLDYVYDEKIITELALLEACRVYTLQCDVCKNIGSHNGHVEWGCYMTVDVFMLI